MEFKIDDSVWHIEPNPPYEESQWRILARASALETEPPVKWRCGRTNEAEKWEERVFKEENLSSNHSPVIC